MKHFIQVLCCFCLLFLIRPEAYASGSGADGESRFWLQLYRDRGVEILYWGIPGSHAGSMAFRYFRVKSGRPGIRPTPLPRKAGRAYWTVTAGTESRDNPETAPYFLTLDIPVSSGPPYGPVPYLECNGQCDWVLPGAFGLHGTAGNPLKLADSDPGSSGCIRHRDADIMYLYGILHPERERIRYYITDTSVPDSAIAGMF